MPPSALPGQVPSRASLKSWWKHWILLQKMKAREPQYDGKVFGIPLRESLRTASVQISTANQDGELYVWGYIPVVVAKCGLFLKEHGTEVEGTFRVSGSSKRMSELQAIFEAPPKYGKNIEWKDHYFTPHDVASVFRRFLTQMPEPIISHKLYHDFRNVYSKKPFVQEDVIAQFKRLIASMPRANQYLLLYVLDLLTVFARRAEKNRMNASNLAVIFRPAVLNHPSHEMSPDHHRLSQEVVEFLIEHQDWFMLDIPPPPRQDEILAVAEGAHSSAKKHSASKHMSTPVGGKVEIPEDAYLGPMTSDDDKEGGAGWRMVGSLGGSGQVRRRRTFSERGSAREQSTSGPYASASQLSSVGLTNARPGDNPVRLVEKSVADSKPNLTANDISGAPSAFPGTNGHYPAVGNASVRLSADVHANATRGGELTAVNEHVTSRERGVHPHSSGVNPNLTAAQASKHAAFTPPAEEKKGRTIKDMFSLGGGGGAGVKRRRTLPNHGPTRGEGEATGQGEAGMEGRTGGRVLRKKWSAGQLKSK